MAGSIAYVSFPQFTRNRQSIMSTICRRLLEALLTLSGTSSCFPRSGRAPESRSSQGSSLTKAADARSQGFATESAIGSTKSQHDNTLPHHNILLEDHISNPHILTRQPSSSSSSTTAPASSLCSIPSTLRASLGRRISSWRSDHSNPWSVEDVVRPTENHTTTSFENTGTTQSENKLDNGDFIASLDALALSQHEREVLSRMQLVCRSARAARERRPRTRDWSDAYAINGVEPGLCLRGGGDDDDDVRPFRTPRRRTTLPVSEPVFPKADSARPPRGLWWLAGGRKGQVPTVGELRVRKEVERANRRIVGFWGTVLGVRRVERVGILDEIEGGVNGGGDADEDAGGGGGEGVLENADASSSHSSKSMDSVMGAPGASGGGSVASSHSEREVEADQSVEAKAESVASANSNSERSKAGSLNGTAKGQRSSEYRSTKDAAAEEPKVESDSAKSVAEDQECTKAGSVKDAGAEEPKVRSESARSVPEDIMMAGAESVKCREGTDETEAKGEEDTKSPSND